MVERIDSKVRDGVEVYKREDGVGLEYQNWRFEAKHARQK